MKPQYVRTIVQLALAEDIGEGDITTDNLVPLKSKSHARLVAKSFGIICGLDLARAVFKILDPKIKFDPKVRDGQAVAAGKLLAEIVGSTRALLTGERVALNLLSMLSGIATQTHAYVQKIKPYKTAILDTRKTTPLLRQLERYAVKMGGGTNHRFNLNDMVMIKDNHRVFSKSINFLQTVDKLKTKIKAKIEVEVDTLEQLKEALKSKADLILLDNMSPKQVAQAVKMRRQAQSSVPLEASGGMTLSNIKKYAATGVDRISVGALTHSRQSLNISMELD